MYSLKNKQHQLKQTTPKSRLIFILGSLLLLFVAALVLEKTGVTDFYHKAQSPTTDGTESSINYDPPTEEEVKAGDEKKQEIIQEEESTPTEPVTEANVVIVDASQYDNSVEVRAFVSNIIKDGTCSFTFTKDNNKVTKVGPAFGDASSTPCIAQTIPVSEFSESGEWNLVVRYEADGVAGSAETTVNINTANN